jgi:hypothetical protein
MSIKNSNIAEHRYDKEGRLLCGATVKVYDKEYGDEVGAVGISFIWCKKGNWSD